MAELPELPPGMALAWGVSAPPGRGPKRTLTLERVVAAGVGVAVADGLDAVSMGRVATELGVSTMALYRYVPNKDALLELMVDSSLGLPPEPVSGEGWREGLRRWGVGVRDAYRAHPWALRVPITAPPLGPNNIRWLENALHALRDTPLDAQQRMSCVMLISGFVRNEETLQIDIRAGEQRGGIDAMQWGTLLAQLVNPVEFPQLSWVLSADVLADEDDAEFEFEFGLERVLDGIAALISSLEG